MKKFFILALVLGMSGLTAFAQNNNSGWKSHTQCEKNETPQANSNGAFSTTYSTTNTSAQQKEGTQNHYNGNVNGSVKAETRTPVSSSSVNAGAGAGISRDGEKKTTNSSSTNSESHTIRYDCVPTEQKK